MRAARFLAFGATLLCLGFVSSGCKSSSSNPYGSTPTGPGPTPSPANTVLMQGMAFSPATITVSVGTTVTWKNQDSYAHTSTSDSGIWDTGNIAGGASATTTFNAAGTYPYHCTFHVSMGMKGTVIVQ
jgi:plastocyanin